MIAVTVTRTGLDRDTDLESESDSDVRGITGTAGARRQRGNRAKAHCLGAGLSSLKLEDHVQVCDAAAAAGAKIMPKKLT